MNIIYSFESISAADWPAQGIHLDLQFFFDIIQYVKWIVCRTVQFVDKYDYRCFAHPAYLHEFAGLGFHSFSCINDNNYAVAGGQCPEGIFCKILVAGSVQDVDFSSFVFKAHDGSCNRYSALTFDFHKVGSSRFLYFVGFYSSGDMDGSSEK